MDLMTFHRADGVGMNWIPDLIAGLRDISIVAFLD